MKAPLPAVRSAAAAAAVGVSTLWASSSALISGPHPVPRTTTADLHNNTIRQCRPQQQ